MKLRPLQEHGLEMLRESFRKAFSCSIAPRVMFAAPCSYGKTVVSAHILKSYQDAGKRALFICDRIKLVNQSLSAFDNLGLDVSVIQSYHERYDSSKPIQIASIASLEKFKAWPDVDVVIIDEAHVMRKSVIEQMDKWDAVPFIGLSATPYTKGLGLLFSDLIVPATPEQLLANDPPLLCPVEYYGGRKPDLSQAKLKSLKSGGSDYTTDSLAAIIDEDKLLAGDILDNWKSKAVGKMTIAFSPSVPHSKKMVQLFNEAGVSAIHIDGYMKKEQQDEIFKAHQNGEFLVLSCSRLLNTGYDEPGIECLIDCYPTKSITQYVQRAGRIMRIAEGKSKAIYLDHAGNVRKHGFAESIVPEELHDGKKDYSESSLTKERPKAKIQECPMCYREMQGRRCSCGYEKPGKYEDLHTDDQVLELITDGKQWNKQTKKDDKERFYGMLKHYAISKGYKMGWADNKYRERSGVWPNKIKDAPLVKPDAEFNKYMQHLRIKNAYSTKHQRYKTN